MNKNLLLNKNNTVFFLYFLLSYPLFYFSYKFCLPDFGGQDFYSYYLLYGNWEFDRVPSPFNMRLVSSCIIYLMNQAGFYYDTEIVFKTVYSQFDQQIFFNAVFFNYLSVVVTCFVIYVLIKKQFKNELYSFLIGALYLMGFGTLFFSLKPLTESLGILLVAIAFLLYVKHSNWIYLILLISVFQREYIFFVFGIIAFLDFLFLKKKYFANVFSCSVLLFVTYFILRKTYFFTPHFEYQTSMNTFVGSLFNSGIEWIPFIKQSFFTSNLLILYLFIILYKRILNYSVSKQHLIIVITLFAHVILMSIMARFGNSAGRYFYYTVPILLYYIAIELKPLLLSQLRFDDND